jgi:hypothetical protein
VRLICSRQNIQPTFRQVPRNDKRLISFDSAGIYHSVIGREHNLAGSVFVTVTTHTSGLQYGLDLLSKAHWLLIFFAATETEQAKKKSTK